MAIVAYIFKNIGLILGIVEFIVLGIGQILKAAAGIVHLTPSRVDDEWVNRVEQVFEGKIVPMFDKMKRFLYNVKQSQDSGQDEKPYERPIPPYK